MISLAMAARELKTIKGKTNEKTRLLPPLFASAGGLAAIKFRQP
jgi:hypothetical protein